LKKNMTPIILSACCLVLLLGFLYFFYIYPAAGLGPAQPISFSHQVHAGVKAIQCPFCHPYVGLSTFPGIPPVEKCLFCHRYVIPEHPEIRKEHRYYDTGTSTPWVKVNYVPEFVFFNHERHIRKEIDCEECHGAVKTMDRLPRHIFQMGFCVECHRKKGADIGCWLSCHN
jgi:hypothetical protein